jgi:L-amino acid N-acyltransferase YncA
VPHQSDIEIREATAADAAAVAALYNVFVLETTVTFEGEAVPDDVIAGRIAAVKETGLPWIVAIEEGRLAGYAYAAPWNARAAYRLTVEVTAYVRADAAGHGLGTRLYQELFARLRALGTHAVIAVIALPNPGSVALHEHFGLRKAGLFQEIGRKFGRWVDVGYWQAVL